jgi:hypothetical protein
MKRQRIVIHDSTNGQYCITSIMLRPRKTAPLEYELNGCFMKFWKQTAHAVWYKVTGWAEKDYLLTKV